MPEPKQIISSQSISVLSAYLDEPLPVPDEVSQAWRTSLRRYAALVSLAGEILSWQDAAADRPRASKNPKLTQKLRELVPRRAFDLEGDDVISAVHALSLEADADAAMACKEVVFHLADKQSVSARISRHITTVQHEFPWHNIDKVEIRWPLVLARILEDESIRGSLGMRQPSPVVRQRITAATAYWFETRAWWHTASDAAAEMREITRLISLEARITRRTRGILIPGSKEAMKDELEQLREGLGIVAQAPTRSRVARFLGIASAAPIVRTSPAQLQVLREQLGRSVDLEALPSSDPILQTMLNSRKNFAAIAFRQASSQLLNELSAVAENSSVGYELAKQEAHLSQTSHANISDEVMQRIEHGIESLIQDPQLKAELGVSTAGNGLQVTAQSLTPE